MVWGNHNSRRGRERMGEEKKSPKTNQVAARGRYERGTGAKFSQEILTEKEGTAGLLAGEPAQ